MAGLSMIKAFTDGELKLRRSSPADGQARRWRRIVVAISGVRAVTSVATIHKGCDALLFRFHAVDHVLPETAAGVISSDGLQDLYRSAVCRRSSGGGSGTSCSHGIIHDLGADHGHGLIGWIHPA